LLESVPVGPGHGGRQQRLETIRDTGERGVNDHRPQRRGDAGPHYTCDIVPIAGGGHAGAAELEHNPVLIIFQHSGTCDLNSASPNRVLLPTMAELAAAPRLELIVFENIAQFFF
jgi:hypothetical protein